MTLHDILKGKGTHVHTIHPGATLQEAVEELIRHNVGSLVVCDRDERSAEQLVGIVTERDVLHVCAAGRGPLASIPVAEIMTRDLITCSPDDAAEQAMGVMTTHRVRHLPVLAKGRLVGLISIGDLLKAQHARLAMENEFMKSYIIGTERRAT